MEQATEPQSQTSQSSLFERLKSYPFNKDPEFANGLSIILGHPDVPASETEIDRDDDLVLQAKCFYFSRKNNLSPPLHPASYKAWLALNAGAEESSDDPMRLSRQAMESTLMQTPPQEPMYPSSFAHIVELITTGQPIPGIQQIPDTVLTGHDTSSQKPRRLKPWEKEQDQISETV